jgi:flagellar hook-length control protein FliK
MIPEFLTNKSTANRNGADPLSTTDANSVGNVLSQGAFQKALQKQSAERSTLEQSLSSSKQPSVSASEKSRSDTSIVSSSQATRSRLVAQPGDTAKAAQNEQAEVRSESSRQIRRIDQGESPGTGRATSQASGKPGEADSEVKLSQPLSSNEAADFAEPGTLRSLIRLRPGQSSGNRVSEDAASKVLADGAVVAGNDLPVVAVPGGERTLAIDVNIFPNINDVLIPVNEYSTVQAAQITSTDPSLTGSLPVDAEPLALEIQFENHDVLSLPTLPSLRPDVTITSPFRTPVTTDAEADAAVFAALGDIPGESVSVAAVVFPEPGVDSVGRPVSIGRQPSSVSTDVAANQPLSDGRPATGSEPLILPSLAAGTKPTLAATASNTNALGQAPVNRDVASSVQPLDVVQEVSHESAGDFAESNDSATTGLGTGGSPTTSLQEGDALVGESETSDAGQTQTPATPGSRTPDSIVGTLSTAADVVTGRVPVSSPVSLNDHVETPQTRPVDPAPNEGNLSDDAERSLDHGTAVLSLDQTPAGFAPVNRPGDSRAVTNSELTAAEELIPGNGESARTDSLAARKASGADLEAGTDAEPHSELTLDEIAPALDQAATIEFDTVSVQPPSQARPDQTNSDPLKARSPQQNESQPRVDVSRSVSVSLGEVAAESRDEGPVEQVSAASRINSSIPQPTQPQIGVTIPTGSVDVPTDSGPASNTAAAESSAAVSSSVSVESPSATVTGSSPVHVPATATPIVRSSNTAGAASSREPAVPLEIQEAVSAIQDATSSDSHIRVRLNPRELGTMLVDVSRTDGRIVARLEVESAAARVAILETLPDLHQALARSGAAVDRVEVVLNESRAESGRQDSDQSQQRDQQQSRQERQSSEQRQARDEQPQRREQDQRRRQSDQSETSTDDAADIQHMEELDIKL